MTDQSGPLTTTVLSSSEMDAAKMGMLASIIGGSILLAAAIFYVTTVQVDSDYAYLLLGCLLGATSLGVIVFLELMKREKIPTFEGVFPDYLGSTAVVFGTLSMVWLSRFSIWFLVQEVSLISPGIGNGEVDWIPDWMTFVQALSVLSAVLIGVWQSERHGLGNTVRTVLVLAPICMALSVMSIWEDWTASGLGMWTSLGYITLLTSSIIISLRLDRAQLFLISAGSATLFPLLLSSIAEFGIDAIGLLVPIVIITGITAIDKSLDRKMIENSSGFIVGAILLAQFISSGESFLFGGVTISNPPYDLSFVLWAALLVGWFGSTYMQRTPAMPIGLALAIAMLHGEGSAIAWCVGIVAFVYLATRDHARDWVVMGTFAALAASWWFSSLIVGDSSDTLFGAIEASDLLFYGIFPILVILSIWQTSEGRFHSSMVGGLAVIGSLTPAVLIDADPIFSSVVIAAALTSLFLRVRAASDEEHVPTWELFLPLLAILITSFSSGPASVGEGGTSNPYVLFILPISALAIHIICFPIREKECWDVNATWSADPGTRLSLGAVFLLLLLAQFIGLSESTVAESVSFPINEIRLFLFIATVALGAHEAGAFEVKTPYSRMMAALGSLTLLFLTGVTDQPTLTGAIIREVALISCLLAISYRYQATGKVTPEERQTDSGVLLVLLVASIFDISGGLWALTVLLVVADRSIRYQHGFIQILVAPVVLLIGVVSTSGFQNHNLVWGILEQIPYLGETSNLLGESVLPRWTTILLAIMCVISVVRHRKITIAKSEYTPYLPIFWILIIVAVIVPDGRYVPPILTIFATFAALRSGYLGWFWFNPFAAMWSAFCIMEMSVESGLTTLQPYTGALMTFGVISFVQYIVYLRGDLHRWIQTDRVQLNDDFNLGETPSSFSPFGIYNRLLGYTAFIVFPSEEMYDFLPSIRVFMMSILAYDLYRNRSVIGLRIWVLPMTFFLAELLDHTTYDYSLDEGWTHLATLVLVVSGIYQLYKSYIFENEIGESDTGWATGTIGTIYALSGVLFFVDGHNSFQGQDLAALSGFAMVTVFGHHLVLGFNRNDGWRRLMSLFGLPVGIIFTGFELGELFGIVALFLAAMTMIAQGIMYSARGGLGMGSVKEDGVGHLDPVKVLEVTGLGGTLPALDQEEIYESDKANNLPATITESEEEEEEADDNIQDREEKAREAASIDTETVEEIVQDEIKGISRKVSDVRFPIFGSDLQMEITGGMVSRIASVVATGNPGFVPIIRIDDAGVVSVQWESIGGSTQSE
ncbi:MAG: hypothetical protein ACJZ49_06405 [Candidatus Thalassarchaeaceae archaeon]